MVPAACRGMVIWQCGSSEPAGNSGQRGSVRGPSFAGSHFCSHSNRHEAHSRCLGKTVSLNFQKTFGNLFFCVNSPPRGLCVALTYLSSLGSYLSCFPTPSCNRSQRSVTPVYCGLSGSCPPVPWLAHSSSPCPISLPAEFHFKLLTLQVSQKPFLLPHVGIGCVLGLLSLLNFCHHKKT